MMAPYSVFRFAHLTKQTTAKFARMFTTKKKVSRNCPQAYRRACQLLLLYTQHVKEVKLFEIKDGSTPSALGLLFVHFQEFFKDLEIQ